MNSIEVGKRYPGSIGNEGVTLDYNNGFTLYVFIPDITPTEANGFKKGKYKFALTEVQGILFFLSEFKGAISMSDSPFHFGLYKDNRVKNLPTTFGDSEGLALNIVVVDSATSIVKALRMIGLSNEFSAKLLEICLKQSQQTVDPTKYNRQLYDIQGRYSADVLYRMASVECEGH